MNLNELRANRLTAFDEHLRQLVHLDDRKPGIAAGWFLGPKAENQELLEELILEAIRKHSQYRRDFHPEDPEYMTKAVKDSAGYKNAVANLKRFSTELFDTLQKSAPFFSMRHQAHMLWDQALPSMIGYFAAMLYNQNNVAAEASPVTTQLEIQVGNDLCKMLGYEVKPKDA